jgi:hypothetical protein
VTFNLNDLLVLIYLHYRSFPLPVTVAARSKAVFVRSDAGIVGSNPT